MLRFYFIGRIEIQASSGEVIKLPTRQMEQLLAYLWTKRNEPQLSRLKMGRLFWPQPDDDDRQRQSVRQALYQINKLLSPHSKHKIIDSTRNKVWFNLETYCIVDIAEFYQKRKAAQSVYDDNAIELLEDAAKICGGREFIGSCEDLFDDFENFAYDWCSEENDQLQKDYRDTLLKLIHAYRERESFDDLIRCGELYLNSDKMEESIYRELIYAYHTKGDPIGVAKIIGRLNSMLEELAIDSPLPETTAVIESVTQGGTREEIEQASRDARQWITRYPRLMTPFVGRERERGKMMSAWNSLENGSGKAFIISGEPGAGKTELAKKVLSYSKLEGALVLQGSCRQSELPGLYEPWIDAFNAAIHDKLIPTHILGEIGEIWLSELSKYMPSINERFPQLDPSEVLPSPDEENLRMTEAFMKLIRILASQLPLVVLLDDLQWAHEATLELNRQIIKELDMLPILIIKTTRPEGMLDSHSLGELCAALIKDDLIEEIKLNVFTRPEVEELVYAMLQIHDEHCPPQLIDLLMSNSKGNVLVVESSIQWFVETQVLTLNERGEWTIDEEKLENSSIPPRVDAQVKTRLRSVSPRSREMLEIASTRSGAFDFKFLQRAVDRSETELIEMLDELLAFRILRSAERGHQFHHTIMQEAILSSLSPERRRHRHRQTAKALEALHHNQKSGYRSEILPELAEHFHLAGDLEKSLEYSLLAGEHLWKQSYAKREALSLFERSLTLAQNLNAKESEMNALKGIGEVCSFTDEQERGLECCERALELCKDSEMRAEMYLAIANVHHVNRDLESGLEYCERSLRELGLKNSSLTSAKAHYYASTFLNWLQQSENAIKHCLQGIQILDENDDLNLRSLILGELGQAQISLGLYSDATRSFDKSTKLAEKFGNAYTLANSYFKLALSYYYDSNIEFAIEKWEAAVQSLKTLHLFNDLSDLYNWLTCASMRIGNYDQAMVYANQQLHYAIQSDNLISIGRSKGMLGSLHLLRNEPEISFSLLEEAINLSNHDSSVYLNIIKSYLRLFCLKEAIEWLGRGMPFLTARHIDNLMAGLSENEIFEQFRSDERVKAMIDQIEG